MNTQRFKLYTVRCLSIATILVLGAGLAQAHPGHSFYDATPRHLLTSLDHFLVLVTIGVLLFFGARFVQRTWPRRALQGASVLALAGAVAIWCSHI